MALTAQLKDRKCRGNSWKPPRAPSWPPLLSSPLTWVRLHPERWLRNLATYAPASNVFSLFIFSPLPLFSTPQGSLPPEWHVVSSCYFPNSNNFIQTFDNTYTHRYNTYGGIDIRIHVGIYISMLCPYHVDRSTSCRCVGIFFVF